MKPLIERLNWTRGEQICFALVSLAVCFAAGYIGGTFEYIGGLYIKGPAAVMCVLSFLCAFTPVMHSVDEHRREHPDDERGGF